MEPSPSTPRPPGVHQLVVPDLGVGCLPLVVSLWLVQEGANVTEGDRVVELVCGGVTVDLEAPVSGRFVRQMFDEDSPVSPGAAIAEFEATGTA